MKVRIKRKTIYILSIIVGILLVTVGIFAFNGFFGGGASIPDDTMSRGLVGYWSFDEGNGTTAYDLSGNNNNGALTNGPQWTKGKVNGALSFDGKDDYVQATVSQGTTTVELWVKNNNTWQYVVNVSGTYYVNGVLGSPTFYPIYFSGNTIQIGKTGASAYFFGSIDEVRIYNRALTVAEVLYHYNHGGPVAYWKFDEGSGSTAYDSSGNLHLGTVHSCPEGWIPVPGNSAFGTSDFCVMKYEAKCANVSSPATGLTSPAGAYNTYINSTTPCTSGNSKVVVSTASGYPIAYISQINSITYCQAIGGHLLTDNETQTINRNIEQVGNNWFGGTVGINFMYSGHNDETSGGGNYVALAASSNDTYGYYGTGDSTDNINPGVCDGRYNNYALGDDTVTGRACAGQKRTFILSNGEVVWDWSGNVWEWIYGDGTGGQIGTTGGVSWRDTAGYIEWNNVDLNEERPILGPSTSTWTATQGIGRYYGGVSTNAFLRGGYWGGGAVAGLFSLTLRNAPDYTDYSVGFRCAR